MLQTENTKTSETNFGEGFPSDLTRLIHESEVRLEFPGKDCEVFQGKWAAPPDLLRIYGRAAHIFLPAGICTGLRSKGARAVIEKRAYAFGR